MPSKEMLSARYPDLLDEQDQPDLLALVGDLDAIYSAPEPPEHLTLAGALAQRERVAEPRPQQRRWLSRFQPVRPFPRRIGIAAAALMLAVLLTVTTAYALAPVLFPPTPFDPGTNQVSQNSLYEDVNPAPQKVDSFTVSVEVAYADTNRVLVGYKIAAPPGHSYTDLYLTPVLLTTKQGITLRLIQAGSVGQAGERLLTFDAVNSVVGTPKTLDLHFTAGGLVGSEQDGSSGHAIAVQKNMAFDFSVTFHPGRVAVLNQSVTANGTTLTLERVIVTLTETRLYVRGSGYDIVPSMKIPSLTVSDGLSQSNQPGILMIWPAGQNVQAFSFLRSLYDKHGDWTFTLQSQTGDPWIFHFVVP